MKLVILIYTALLLLLVSNAEASKLNEKQIREHIVNTALKYEVDPQLALAIAMVESSMNSNAVGTMGEIGLFQLRPEYHDVKPGHTKHNIEIAIKYLAYLKQQCARFGDAYFICYNNGPYRNPKHPTLFPYYKKVKEQMNRTLIAKGE